MKRRNRRRLLRPLPLRDYLAFNTIVALVIEAAQAAVIAGLAASRADGHRLTATQTAVVLAAGAVFAVGIGSLISFYSGLSEAAAGLVLAGDSRPPASKADPFTPRALWGRAALAAVVAAAWGIGLGLLVVAVLNGRQAGYPILFAGLFVAAGGASVVRGLIGRAGGAAVALNPPQTMTPRPVRRRAWLELALPLALLVAVANGAFTWLLFHDYTVGGSLLGGRVLTEQQVLADILTLVVVNSLIVAFICGRAGRAEAAMKLITFEDPVSQIPDGKAGFGVQIFVYTVIAALLVTSLVRFLLPGLPNLWEAIAARAFLAASTAFVAAGFAYVRGAANMTAGAAALVPRYNPTQSVAT